MENTERRLLLALLLVCKFLFLNIFLARATNTLIMRSINSSAFYAQID